MRSHRTILVSLGVLAALALSSCSSSTEGIFASIEREQKIVSLGGLSETATVTSMAELGTTAGGTVNKYFATGGKALFSRSTDTSAKTWHKATVAGSSAASVGAVHGATDRLFAVADGKLYWSDSGSLWTQAAGLDTGDRAESLVPVRKDDGVSNSELIVVVSTSDAYRKVYRLDSSGALSAAITLSSDNLVAPVHSAVFDGSDYYLASETDLWKVSSALAVSSLATSQNSNLDFAGLIYLGNSVEAGAYQGFYVSSSNRGTTGGGLYKVVTTATPWTFTGLETGVKSAVNSDPVGFGAILYNPDNKSLWLATGAAVNLEGAGYMEYLLSTSDFLRTPRTNANNYTSSSLPTYAVGALYRSSSGLSLLGTVAHGLWLWDSSSSSSSDRTWSRQ